MLSRADSSIEECGAASEVSANKIRRFAHPTLFMDAALRRGNVALRWVIRKKTMQNKKDISPVMRYAFEAVEILIYGVFGVAAGFGGVPEAPSAVRPARVTAMRFWAFGPSATCTLIER